MKIAVLSDIHGNLTALEAVLENIRTKECDKILFLGDYALAGPEPSDTVNFCMSLSEHDNVEMIQGNTDKMIAEYSEEIFNNVKKGAPIMANALRKEFETLSENQKQFLKNLPVSKELEIDGIKILMVHGSPRRNNEDIMPDTPLDKLEEMLEGVKADLILLQKEIKNLKLNIILFNMTISKLLKFWHQEILKVLISWQACLSIQAKDTCNYYQLNSV
jgi:predicted phosphodiesterase